MSNKAFAQSSFLVYGIVVGTSTLIPFSYLSQPQDQWIAILIGGVWTLILFFLYRSLLSSGNKGEDFIDLIRSSFGRITSIVFLSVYWLFIAFVTAKDLAIVWDTIVNLTLPKHTSTFIAAIVIIHIYLICVQGGMKSILQLSVFLSTICFFLNVVVILLSISEIKIDHFFPILYDGFQPLVREAYLISTKSSGEILLLLFLPQICDEIRSNIKPLLIPIIFITLTNLFKFTVSVGLLGEYIKYIPLTTSGTATGVLTFGNAQLRIEPLVILAWFVTAVIKLSVEYYILAKLSTKFLKNININTYLFPVGLIVWSLSLLAFKNQLEIIHFPKTYAVYATIFQLIIPLSVWLGLKIRRIKDPYRI